MELNNKQDLLKLLAESEYQELSPDGKWAVKSIFEDMPRERVIRIFKDTRENLKEFLQEQATQNSGKITITPMEVLTVGLRNVQLEDTLEILHYLFEAGRSYQDLHQRFEKIDEAAKGIQDRLEEEGADGPLAVAIALDNVFPEIVSLLQNCQVDPYWVGRREWLGQLQERLDRIQVLIKKLY